MLLIMHVDSGFLQTSPGLSHYKGKDLQAAELPRGVRGVRDARGNKVAMGWWTGGGGVGRAHADLRRQCPHIIFLRRAKDGVALLVRPRVWVGRRVRRRL